MKRLDDGPPTASKNVAGVISVWPCKHNGVEVEYCRVPLGHMCSECGEHPKHYAPVTEEGSG